jgi:D-3-phosphoglycerate dehydrogenase
MRVVIPDDYQDAVRGLGCFSRLDGFEVSVYHDTLSDIDGLAARFADADALVLIRERTRITAELLQRLPRLKLISQTGKGAAHIDIEACTRRGILVAVGSGSPVAPAELTFALILAAARRLPKEITALRGGRWQSTLGVALHGRTLGIYGYGKIGALLAHYGKAFGMRVVVWGREGSLQRAAADGVAVAAGADELFAGADVLSL